MLRFSALVFFLSVVSQGLVAPPLRAAEDRAGEFDYYVLSLSWSPSYCEAEGKRANRFQCASPRPYAFVVHGFWPQYEKGWPQYCRIQRYRGLREREVDSMLDIMPSPSLVRHQWKKHGTCSGLAPGGYLDTLRRAYEKVTIPPRLTRLDDYVMVDPSSVEKAFRAANPGLMAAGVAVTCDRRRLREVRICMTRDLKFRRCDAVDRRGCRSRRVVMPPTR